jgi:hypothetical protein
MHEMFFLGFGIWDKRNAYKILEGELEGKEKN